MRGVVLRLGLRSPEALSPDGTLRWLLLLQLRGRRGLVLGLGLWRLVGLTTSSQEPLGLLWGLGVLLLRRVELLLLLGLGVLLWLLVSIPSGVAVLIRLTVSLGVSLCGGKGLMLGRLLVLILLLCLVWVVVTSRLSPVAPLRCGLIFPALLRGLGVGGVLLVVIMLGLPLRLRLW